MIVGAWLGFSWQLLLVQRVSNEQSNVDPTKYVAVGPTLNQRLGFGWRMVIVLAGTSQCYQKMGSKRIEFTLEEDPLLNICRLYRRHNQLN